MPFIVRGQGIPSGSVIDTPVLSIDAAASALEIAGAQPSPAQLDGVSFMPLLTGRAAAAAERPLFWRLGRKHALRSGDWKIIRDGEKWELYNLSRDIGETADCADQEPARLQQMERLWDAWNAEQVEPLWQ